MKDQCLLKVPGRALPTAALLCFVLHVFVKKAAFIPCLGGCNEEEPWEPST